MTHPLLREAIALARAGRRREARDLLLRLVDLDEENELAWLWLVDLVDDPQDQIIALENVLTLNPDNRQAWLRLRQLQAVQAADRPEDPPPPATGDDELDRELLTPGRDLDAVARRYEAEGELEKAITVYEQMAARARKGGPRRKARANAAAVRRRLELRQPVPYHTTSTLVRLSLGPFFLYLLLIFIHGAYRPWQISPLLCLGSFAVLGGSLLLVGSRSTPEHPGWRRLLGADGARAGGQRILVGTLGFLLVALPYLGFFLAAIRRLLTTPGAPLPGGQ